MADGIMTATDNANIEKAPSVLFTMTDAILHYIYRSTKPGNLQNPTFTELLDSKVLLLRQSQILSTQFTTMVMKVDCENEKQK